MTTMTRGMNRCYVITRALISASREHSAGGARRAQVLEQVVEVLSGRGYAAMRFADVSQASGVAVSTLQGYFESREDMLIEALQGAISGEVKALVELASGFEDRWQQLGALVGLGPSTPVPTWRMLMEFWTGAAHDTELRAHAAALAEQYRQPFVEAVERGVEAGSFSPQFEVNVLGLGAAVIAEFSDIPAGRIAELTDPAGAQFALLTLAPRT